MVVSSPTLFQVSLGALGLCLAVLALRFGTRTFCFQSMFYLVGV